MISGGAVFEDKYAYFRSKWNLDEDEGSSKQKTEFIDFQTSPPGSIGEAGRVDYRLGGESEGIELETFAVDKDPSAFAALFTNRHSSFIKRGKNGDWRETSQFHQLSDEEIIECISVHTNFQRAVKCDVLTRMAVITIDDESYYRTPIGLSKLRDCLRCVGVNTTKLYKFAESGQMEMFIYLTDAVDSKSLANLLSAWLRRNGIVPGTAGLSVYPGAGILPLPLQPGFCWLNDAGQPIASRDQISLDAALALFFSDFERTAIEGVALIERLEQILVREGG